MLVNTNNFTFKADTTYYVRANVNLSGTTILESAVIKFTNGNSTAKLVIQGPLDCRTDSFRPAIFCGKDENQIGEQIPESTGNPTTNYYGYFVDITGNTNEIDLHDVHMRRGYYGVNMNSSSKLILRNAQISSNYTALVGSSAQTRLRNVLIHDMYFAYGAGGTNHHWEHVTFHRLGNLRSSGYNTFLTNCLVIAVTNNVVYTGQNVVSNLNDSGFFQTVGFGAHYLVSGSTNRNAGTTNINPDLLTALKQRTTYPPVILTNFIANDFTLSPQVSRDTNAPDLGYLYDPLDYFVSGVTIASNVTVTATNGVAIGIDYSQSSWGFILDSARFLSVGSPVAFNRIVRAHVVQEHGGGNPGSRALFYDNYSGGTPPRLSQARFRFTEFSQMVEDGYLIYSGQGFSNLEWTHSRVYNSSLVIDTSGNGVLVCGLTNTLWERGGVMFGVNSTTGTNVTVHMRNNLARNVASWHFFKGSNSWTIHDNLFDSVSVLTNNGSVVQNWTNAYYNTFWGLSSGVGNTSLGSLTYETNLYGKYYQPINSVLINKGTRTADLAQLYHFTTTLNQIKETNSFVDIGLHYVALNGSGQPMDSDNDGTPDYVEDLNGNGIADGADGSENSHINPVLSIASPMDYIKGGPAKRLDTNAVAYDSDSVNFNGGLLTVKITTGAEANDLLAIRNQGTGANQIGATTNTITYSGTNIATYTGGSGTNALVISFNTNAVNTSVQALVRNLTFQSISNAPANSNRVLNFTLTDGRGGTNAPVSQTINFICPAAIDAMIVIDISQSLSDSEFQQAKQAASNFVTHLNFATDRVGLVSFAGYAYLNSVLTNNGAYVQSNILSLITNGGTRFQPPLDLARSNLINTASNTLPLILLLSDGQSGGPENFYTNRVLATNAALAVKDAGIRIISVAYGNEGGTNGGTNLMKWFASSPNDFYYAPTIPEINSNFTAIADGICRGFSLVAITNPANNPTTFVAPSSITIGASASDSEGVSKVEFYNFGTNKLGEDLSSPYSLDWLSPHFGTNQLSARAIDNLGISTTSAVVTVIVHLPPSISLVSPTNAAGFAQVMNLLVRASAADADGWITNVQFFTNGATTPFKTTTNPPFQAAWTGLVSGAYAVHAVARDNHGYSRTSATNTFNVDACAQVGVSNVTLSPSTVVGGWNVLATITLTNSAPAGGQAVALSSTSPNVSIPSSVLVPADTNKVTFIINTYAVSAQDTASIEARTPLGSKSANLTIEAAAFESARFSGQCGPVDLVFTFHRAVNIDDALLALRLEITNIVDSLEFGSGDDYRLALVTFGHESCNGTAAANISVDQDFTTNRIAFFDSLLGVQTEAWNHNPRSWDEALNTIVNQPPEDSSRTNAAGCALQTGSLSSGFRNHARKLIILITDDNPSGLEDTFDAGVDDVNAHRRAVEAGLKGIQISVIQTRRSSVDPCDSNIDEDAATYLLDCVRVTGGSYHAASLDCADVAPLVHTIVSRCGADLGEVVSVRDDLHHQSFGAVSLNNSSLVGVAQNPATFDFVGMSGPVIAAHVSRAGHLRINYGSQFDLSLGVASFLDTNLQSFALPTYAAYIAAVGSSYTTNWHLPFSFFGDMRGYFGGVYPLALLNRVSSFAGIISMSWTRRTSTGLPPRMSSR